MPGALAPPIRQLPWNQAGPAVLLQPTDAGPSTTALYLNADLSGAGTLTASLVPTLNTPADLSGSGSLNAPASPSLSSPAALSGTGSLAAAQAPTLAIAAGMAGSGTLGAATTSAVPLSAPLAGSGTLTATTTPGLAIAVALNGVGALAATTTTLDVPASDLVSGAVEPEFIYGSSWLYQPPAPHREVTAGLGSSGHLACKVTAGLRAKASLRSFGQLRAAMTTDRSSRRRRQEAELLDTL
jgi:hypothetical protein